jgi:hypothetical protein
MKRWVGFGVIADNLINIGRALAPPPTADAARYLTRSIKFRAATSCYSPSRSSSAMLIRRRRGHFQKVIFAPESS